MKVYELIAKLSEYPGGMEVFVSSDAEGNDYNPVWDVEMAPRSKYMEEAHREYNPIHPDDLGEYDDEDIVASVYIYP